jgi:hypothetical protein
VANLDVAVRHPQEGAGGEVSGRIEASRRSSQAKGDEPMISTTVIAKAVESAEPTKRSAQQLAEEEGLSFAGTPGPGYSEGGDVYEPKAAPKGLL